MRSYFLFIDKTNSFQNPCAARLSFVSSSDSLDWKDYDASTICSRVSGKMAAGSIALFHNAALHTPEALPDILESLTHKGLTVVPISQLIYTENYTIDHTGRQFILPQEPA